MMPSFPTSYTEQTLFPGLLYRRATSYKEGAVV